MGWGGGGDLSLMTNPATFNAGKWNTTKRQTVSRQTDRVIVFALVFAIRKTDRQTDRVIVFALVLAIRKIPSCFRFLPFRSSVSPSPDLPGPLLFSAPFPSPHRHPTPAHPPKHSEIQRQKESSRTWKIGRMLGTDSSGSHWRHMSASKLLHWHHTSHPNVWTKSEVCCELSNGLLYYFPKVSCTTFQRSLVLLLLLLLLLLLGNL